MLSFIIYLIVNIGITIIITQSKIFKPIRKLFCKISPNFLGSLISCPMCAGFWLGVFTSFFFFSPTLMINPILNIFLSLIFDGSIASITSYTFYLIIKPHMVNFD